MGEIVIALIAVTSAIVVGVTTYMNIALKGKSKKQKFVAKARASGCYTTGRAIAVEKFLGDRSSNDSLRRNDRKSVKYIYNVNGIDYYKLVVYQNPGMINVTYPVNITIYYDPRNPKKSVCDEEASEANRIESGCLATIGWTLLTMYGVFYILKFLFLRG